MSVSTLPLGLVGRETQIGFFVGGDYIGHEAAEIEGRIVVLGDFIVQKRGPHTLGTLDLIQYIDVVLIFWLDLSSFCASLSLSLYLSIFPFGRFCWSRKWDLA